MIIRSIVFTIFFLVSAYAHAGATCQNGRIISCSANCNTGKVTCTDLGPCTNCQATGVDFLADDVASMLDLLKLEELKSCH